MPVQHIFEYAVFRVVPQVEREEFVNVGVILYCKAAKFLQMRYLLNEERIRAFSNTIDIHEISCYLKGFDLICQGSREGGKIAELDQAERFRWITASRSTIIQTSKVHPGLCITPALMLDRIYTEMVL